MKDKIQKAIFNNNDLYKEIFTNHQLIFHRTHSICYSLDKTIPLYSNLVTVSNDWQPDEIFSKIDANYNNEKWDEWSIKDSFNVLNLNKFGFEKLFDANWFYLEADKFAPTVSDDKLSYKIVENKEDLSMWRMTWDSNEELGKEIFNDKLLDNPRVYFIAGYKNEQIICGCFVNRTKDLLGISNFFAPDKNINYWSEMIGFIFDAIERTDIVGYERKDFTEKLQPIGFEETGNLSVWLKKR